MTEQFEDSYGGIEVINNIDYKYGVSIGNPTGATEYGLRFYFYPDACSDETIRLSAKRGEYELFNVYEDCEVGSVEFSFGGSFYRLNFGHDGDEPFTAEFEKIAKPQDWSYEKTLTVRRKDIDHATASAFVLDRLGYFESIHDSTADAVKAWNAYFDSFCNDFMKPSLWMAA